MYGWVSLLCSHHLYHVPALPKESLSHEIVTPTTPLPGPGSNPSVFCSWICLYWIFHMQRVPYLQTFRLRTLWGDLLGCIGGSSLGGQEGHHCWWKEEVPASGGLGAEGSLWVKGSTLVTPVSSAVWVLLLLLLFCISIKLSCSFYSQLTLKKKFLESPQLTGSVGS